MRKSGPTIKPDIFNISTKMRVNFSAVNLETSWSNEIGVTKSTPVSRRRFTLSVTLVIKFGLNSGFITLAGWF